MRLTDEEINKAFRLGDNHHRNIAQAVANDIFEKIEQFAEGEGHRWSLEKFVQSEFWKELKDEDKM